MKKKKIVKITLIIVSLALVLGAITVAFVLNWHTLFIFAESKGLFCREIDLKQADIEKERDSFSLTTYEALSSDERVTFNQSMMLVNPEHTLPEDFEPKISEYKDTTVYMNDCMISSYAVLSADISKRFNKKLYVSSDFRTADEQQALYDEDPLTATLPGASEHQTGLALDVYVAYYSGDGFVKSPVGRFVNRNSWKYGFIIRYPSHGEDITGIRYEPWHIRYVGHPHADIIYNNHITLEEYIESFEVGCWYETDEYYICRMEILSDLKFAFPADFESCVISPDNTGYAIITVKKQ